MTAASGDGKGVRGRVKCVIWDLDDTLWDGVLLEPGQIRLRANVVRRIRELDERGILHSIASKNDRDAALAKLEELGIAEYFLYPQINWNAKSSSIRQIAGALNIGIDALAFVDDQPFERAEVAHNLPDVLTVDAAEVDSALERPEFRPRFVTGESRHRRAMYQDAAARDRAEQDFVGTSQEFLATLDMELTIREAGPEDLQRAEELTVRTNQLNSTGVTYSFAELDQLRRSPSHLLLCAALKDRYGDYGTIGLCLVEKSSDRWRLLLLIMSCRVMSRGVGTVLLNYVMTLAGEAGARLRADFVDTGRNRMMQVTYMFAGFREAARDGDRVELECAPSSVQEPPAYLRLRVPARSGR